MAEMLAHEIKNPLAGISGAAQLLSMNLETKDLELTDLIVEETRRIVNLLEQVEDFGNSRKPEMTAVNIHDILDRAKRSAQLGFGAHIHFEEEYDPSLPAAVADSDQLLQVVGAACREDLFGFTLFAVFEEMRAIGSQDSVRDRQIESHMHAC